MNYKSNDTPSCQAVATISLAGRADNCISISAKICDIVDDINDKLYSPTPGSATQNDAQCLNDQLDTLQGRLERVLEILDGINNRIA